MPAIIKEIIKLVNSYTSNAYKTKELELFT
jgi:hypothetical protein